MAGAPMPHYCPFSGLALYCGLLFFRSLSLINGFDDPRAVGLGIPGFVWAMRNIFAVRAVVSATVAGALLHGLIWTNKSLTVRNNKSTVFTAFLAAKVSKTANSASRTPPWLPSG
jgi:hypothetical protein